MRRVALVVLVACGGESAVRETPKVARVTPPSVAGQRVTIEVGGAASRGQATPRTLRRLLAERQGQVELASGYPAVSFQVTRVIAGALDDPDYAHRPIGANALEVILADDAAFVAPADMDGFAGTWTLTKLGDGTLVASAIADTPFAKERAADREPLRAQIRASLRAGTPELRRTGLELLDKHPFYELVPDAIALLDDTRVPAPPPNLPPHAIRRQPIHDVAVGVLHRLVSTLGPGQPADDSRAAWDGYWRHVLAPPGEPAPIAAGKTVVLATVAMNQSWPDIVATGDGGFVLGVTRLDTAIDGHRDGIARVVPPYDHRTWVAIDARDGVDAALGRGGVGVLSVGMSDAWHLDIASDPPRAGALADLAGSHAAIAASDTGFVVVSIHEDTPAVFALALDTAGQPVGKTTAIKLPGTPNAHYHHGIHPIAIARRPGGWLVAVEAERAVLLVNLDDALALVSAISLATISDLAQPGIAVGRDRAYVTWIQDGHVMSLVTDLAGRPEGKPVASGSDVALASRPVALADGFAVAWLEDGRELHVGRWGRAGASDVVVARGAAPFALALARDGDALVAGYEDDVRYPFTLLARRL